MVERIAKRGTRRSFLSAIGDFVRRRDSRRPERPFLASSEEKSVSAAEESVFATVKRDRKSLFVAKLADVDADSSFIGGGLETTGRGGGDRGGGGGRGGGKGGRGGGVVTSNEKEFPTDDEDKYVQFGKRRGTSSSFLKRRPSKQLSIMSIEEESEEGEEREEEAGEEAEEGEEEKVIAWRDADEDAKSLFSEWLVDSYDSGGRGSTTSTSSRSRHHPKRVVDEIDGFLDRLESLHQRSEKCRASLARIEVDFESLMPRMERKAIYCSMDSIEADEVSGLSPYAE